MNNRPADRPPDPPTAKWLAPLSFAEYSYSMPFYGDIDDDYLVWRRVSLGNKLLTDVDT